MFVIFPSSSFLMLIFLGFLLFWGVRLITNISEWWFMHKRMLENIETPPPESIINILKFVAGKPLLISCSIALVICVLGNISS